MENKYTYVGEVEVNNVVYGIRYDDNFIYAGLIFNIGFAEIQRSPMDNYTSFDDALQGIIELLENQND